MADLAGYVFGYGSLLDPTSMATTLAGEHAPLNGPAPAWLIGWRRVWNVAVPSGPGQRRPLRYPDGTPYQHDVACLGIEPAGGTRCHGAVYGVTEAALDRLDEREARYDRVDVSALVHAPGAGLRPGPPDAPEHDLPRIGLASDTVVPVWTYVPKPHVPVRFAQLLAAGQVVLTSHYRQTVENGMRLLGEQALAEYRSEPPAACPVADLFPIADPLHQPLDQPLEWPEEATG